MYLQLSESLTESIVPFDATSETPPEEQRTEAMVRVQDALLVRLGPEALGLLRAARSVGPFLVVLLVNVIFALQIKQLVLSP